MKIAVIGYSGAGKSTLARRLGERYDCEVLHLDTVQFTPNWQVRDREEARAMVAAFMARDSWVIDGNYTGFYQERRLEEADRIVFLNFSRLACLVRVIKRARRFRGQTRPDMADGCIEKLDWEFLRWTVWDGRTPARRCKFRDIAERYPEKIITLRSQRELDRFWEAPLC